MAKNENSNFSYMTRRIGGTTYKAVSYTHLDVYKRQVEQRIADLPIGSARADAMHLCV